AEPPHPQPSTLSLPDALPICITLGGTGKAGGDRHPKILPGVLIGAGAKILGNIEIGHCAKVAAGSVVLHSVPDNKTVAGVPARRSEEHTSELQSREKLVCRLL